MRRTKEWWSRLNVTERAQLVFLERAQYSLGGGWNIPDDCSMCPVCSTPHIYGGLCPMCYNELESLIQIADGGKT